jgi:hypothetical protein
MILGKLLFGGDPVCGYIGINPIPALKLVKGMF